jgi:hypothetical protein
MTLKTGQRNEFYRAKHAKSVKAALYELGILMSTLYLTDKVAEFWPQYKEPALMVAVAMLLAMIALVRRNWNSMAILENGLKSDASTRDVEAALRECSYDD